jgi:two-component system chemotaxis response regulator CheB
MAIRVLVVDDSAFMRYAISRQLSADPGIQVVDTASNGAEAVEKVTTLSPDVVTLDVEMPVVDGLEALRLIMLHRPTPVVMLSSLTREGAEVTVRALELGAVDFITKPGNGSAMGIVSLGAELVEKVKVAAHSRPRRGTIVGSSDAARRGLRPTPAAATSVVAIGASTGGPRALYEVIPRLPASLPCAVIVVQHMPAGFTGALARRLDEASSMEVSEAVEGEPIRQGKVYVAPGGRHLVVRSGRIRLEGGPKVHGVRPSVDVALISLAAEFGPKVVAAILTGMGSDGAAGSKAVRAAGGKVIAEDESTCTVFGMPRSVIEAGAADEILPINRIGDRIAQLAVEVAHQ